MIPSKKRAARVFVPVNQRSQRKAKTLQIRNVLVATDFSRASIQAFRAALPLLKHFGAELHLVHVLIHEPIGGLIEIPMVMSDAELKEHARHRLHQMATKYSVPLRPKNVHVPYGRPFEQICQLARDLNVDIIVTSTRGNTGLKHLALGSTAERVVRYSPCPVLVVRSGNRRGKTGRKTFRKILIPIDFSECSIKGLNYAKALARRFHAKLLLHHSIALQYYFANDEYKRHDFPGLVRWAEKTAREQMRELVQRTQWDQVKVETAVDMGHAGQHICDRAKDSDIDLIVTSTHGRTGFKHILLGSTAEYVVRHAPCSVLVVPSHERTVATSTEKRS